VGAAQRVIDRRRDRRQRGADTGAGDGRDVVGLIEISAERDVEHLVGRRTTLGAEAGTDGNRFQAERNLDRLRRRDLRDRAVRLNRIAQHGLAARRIVEIAALVKREVAVSRVRSAAAAVDVVEREEAVAVDGKVRVDAGGLQAALREVGIDRTDLDAVADLLCVDAAQRLSRSRRKSGVLIEKILERDILALIATVPTFAMLFEMTSIWLGMPLNQRRR